MAEAEKKSTSDPRADVSAIKRKLVWRMVIAGVMIVALLGGLALVDYLGTPEVSEPEPTTYSEPVPVAKKVVTQPVTPAPEVLPAASEPVKPVPEATASAVDKSVPPATETTAPANPSRTANAGSRAPTHAPAVASPARPVESARPSENARPVAASSPDESRSLPVRSERTVPPSTVPAPPAVASPPAVESPVAQPAPRLLSGYALQAGVFSDARRAEELHARLVLEGIPSTIETRVQVGPFKNRAEAEAAREKLKGLGIESVLLNPRSGRR